MKFSVFKSPLFFLPLLGLIAYFGMQVFNIWNARFEGANPSFVEHAENGVMVNHMPWQSILDKYLSQDQASGHTFFDYEGVTEEDQTELQNYLSYLQSINPTSLSRNEQFAFWVNLYNAITVDLILDNYPIDSIKELGPALNTGPWDLPVATVNDKVLSLNNIEHGILRPIYEDNRVHYVINCASLGCPNLLPQAITASNLESQLHQAAVSFINHNKGVQFDEGKLFLSSIYNWFVADFDNSEAGVIKHIKEYAHPTLKAQITNYEGNIQYQYDWQLNEDQDDW